MSAAARAREYEALYPGAAADEGQRAERMDRQSFRMERLAGRRTSRTRGVVVPELPWKRGER